MALALFAVVVAGIAIVGMLLIKAPGTVVQGQADCVRDVIDTVVHIPNGIGVCYWEGTWISVGGASREENQALLKRIGKVVYLKVRPETAYDRVKDSLDTRPLLQGEDLFGQIKRMLAARENAYLKASDIIIATDDLSAETIADRVFDLRFDR